MSNELSLTTEQATAMLDSIQLSPEDWNSYAKRTDEQKFLIGVVLMGMRAKGKSLRTIERETGISKDTVQRYLSAALTSVALPTVEEARKEETERLEALIEAVWPKAITGDKDAVASYVKLSERLAKITGTDRPIQTESVFVEITPQEQELQELIVQAQQQAELEELEILDESGS